MTLSHKTTAIATRKCIRLFYCKVSYTGLHCLSFAPQQVAHERPFMSNRKEIVTLRIDADMFSWLKRASRNKRVTVSHLIREALLPVYKSRRK